MSYYSTYRWCAVPECKNTSVKTPDKLWIQVPTDINMRKIWFKVARRNHELLYKKTRLYLCEDHFDLEHDMENYIQYKIMGSVKRIRLKTHCIPSRFDWNRKHKSANDDNLAGAKGLRISIIKDSVQDHIIEEDNFKASSSCIEDNTQPDYRKGNKKRLRLSARRKKRKGPTKKRSAATKNMELEESLFRSSDGTTDATTSSGVCQVIEEDLSVAETLQTSKDEPVDVDESCHSSSTESAESGSDDTSNFMTSENTQTSVADESMDYSIYRFKCNKIIANVYRYLQKEYVSLKSQLGGLCDVSVLSNTLARTAAATGVSQDEVEIALSEAALHSDQTRKPEATHSSAGVRRPRIIRCSKRRTKTLEDKSDNSVRPPKRKAISIPSKPIDEEQIPFPAPIQLRVLGVETQCKIEPVDEPPAMDDPFDAESSSHCDTAEETEIEIKTELVDERPQNIKDDPLAPEWSPTALEESSDSPDVSHTVVKSEHVDHDYADTCWDPSMYDKKRPEIKPKPHSQ